MDRDILDHHIKVEFPALRKRVEKLEGNLTDYTEIRVKVKTMGDKVCSLDKAVGGLGDRVETFFKEMRKAFTDFTKEVRVSNTTFVRWLIGVVLTSLIFGLFFQYKSFLEVHESIHSIERKMGVTLHELEKKIIMQEKPRAD